MKKTYPEVDEKEVINNLKLCTIIGSISMIFLCGTVIVFMPRAWPGFPTFLICSLMLCLPLSNLLSFLHYRRFRNINWLFLRFCIPDNLILTAILYYIGDLKASLAFIYLVPIIMASPIFSFKRISILLSIYASSYLGLTILEGLRIIPSIPVPGLVMARGYFWTVSSVAIILFGIIGVIISKAITSRREKEYELAQAKDYTDSIIESMIDTLIVVDPEAKIKTVNRATSDLLGYIEEELIGQPIEMIFAEEEAPFKGTRTKKLIDEGSYDMTYKTKSGEKIPVSFSGSVIRDEKGEIVGVVGIARDMRGVKWLMQKEKELVAAAAETEKKKSEELQKAYEEIQQKTKELEKANEQLKTATAQLIQSEKLTALGELTAGVAHELNQPLNVTKIICQSILRDINRGQFDREDVQRDLPEIIGQVNRMAEIIDHMRIFTRRTEGMPKTIIDITTVIEGALKFLGQQLKDRNIEIIKELSPDLPKVEGDSVRLEQVFLNLLSNARKAVEVSHKEEKRIAIKTYKIEGEAAVAINVTDNGQGISEENRKKLFQPFFTTAEPGEGTGLGLSVTHKIIEEYKGRIELETAVGKGTTFRIILPIK